MNAELIIDDEAHYLADIAYSEAAGRQAPATDAAIAAAAPRIVAAELRRIADAADARSTVGVVGVASLRRRADELDPPAETD